MALKPNVEALMKMKANNRLPPRPPIPPQSTTTPPPIQSKGAPSAQQQADINKALDGGGPQKPIQFMPGSGTGLQPTTTGGMNSATPVNPTAMMKKGGKVKKMSGGGSASKRADGCAQRGKTRGKMI